MIHQYKMNGYNIVLDQNSGCVHAVDEVAYDIISMFQEKSRDEITAEITKKYSDVTESDVNECFEDIDALIKENKLFSKDVYKDTAFDFKKRQSVVKALCLHIAHDCNMACKYCFADEGEYCGKRSLMSYEVGTKAIDYLLEHSGTRHNLEVDFFGGEPLLNFDVVKQLVAYCHEKEKHYDKKFRFTLTTNGVLIDEDVIDFCNKEMGNVVLSLDGRKEVHDKLRTTINGKGTYDMIVPKFRQLVDARGGKNYYMRGTYTKYNTDFASDVLHMADLGFKELSVEPVVADPNAPYALHEEDLPKLCSEYERLANEMLKRRRNGNGFTFYHYMIDLTGGPCIVKRISGCGVGTEYMAVTPTGEFYPCHQFVGDEKYLLGNIYDGVTNTAIQDEFKMCNVYAHEECNDCFAKLFCSGGCAANAYHTTGKVTGVYKMGCELQKKRLECAIMLKVAEAQDNNEIDL